MRVYHLTDQEQKCSVWSCHFEVIFCKWNFYNLFFFFRVKFVVYSSLLKLWYENLLHLCRNLEIWSGNYRAVTWRIFSDPLILSVGLVLSLYIVTVVSWCPRRLFPGFLLVPLQIVSPLYPHMRNPWIWKANYILINVSE